MNHPLQLRLSESDLYTLKSRLKSDGLNPQISRTLLGSQLNSTISTMLDVRILFSALVDARFSGYRSTFQRTAKGKQYRLPGPELQEKHALEILIEHIRGVASQKHRLRRK